MIKSVSVKYFLCRWIIWTDLHKICSITWTSKSFDPKNCHFRVHVRKMRMQSWGFFPFKVPHFSLRLSMIRAFFASKSFSSLSALAFKFLSFKLNKYQINSIKNCELTLDTKVERRRCFYFCHWCQSFDDRDVSTFNCIVRK